MDYDFNRTLLSKRTGDGNLLHHPCKHANDLDIRIFCHALIIAHNHQYSS